LNIAPGSVGLFFYGDGGYRYFTGTPGSFPELLTILKKACRAEVALYKVHALKVRLPSS
jgi:hypothetical protein